MFTEVVLLALASSVSCFNKEVDEKYHKLPHDEFIKYFNSQNFSYKITHYDGIEKIAVSCADISQLPTSLPTQPKSEYNADFLPLEYDGRLGRWKTCFKKPIEQGECASCWADTVATVASSRRCVITSSPPVLFSSLDLLCCKNCYSKSYCAGGSPEKAALFWLRSGLVSTECKPIDKVHEKSVCKEECVNKTVYYNADKYFAESIYIVMEDDHEIRGSILDGPVVATFALYEDFRDYKEGVYMHTHGKLIGYHTVQVIGYGVENDIPYWLATNSWGESWGEGSLFKVKRFAEELGFEKQILLLKPRFFGNQ